MVEKKTKFTFKLFLLIIEAVALVVSVGSSIYFGTTISTKARYDAEYQDKVSFYNENGFDLLVSGASTDQVNEMKQQSSITHATAASKISLNVKTPAAEDYRDIIVLDSQDDFAYTEFTSERIINETTATDFVYADYEPNNICFDIDIEGTLIATVDTPDWLVKPKNSVFILNLDNRTNLTDDEYRKQYKS